MSGLGCGHDGPPSLSPPSVRLIKFLERRSFWFFAVTTSDRAIGLRGRFVDCHRDIILSAHQGASARVNVIGGNMGFVSGWMLSMLHMGVVLVLHR